MAEARAVARPNAEVEAFLEAAGWGLADRAALAGDASGRRYERLADPLLGTAVLMEAPDPASVLAFVDVGERLRALGLSAPQVLAARPAEGLLLLEDLGDDLLARHVEAGPAEEPALYAAAADALLALRAARTDGLPPYDAEAMARATDLAAIHYAGRPDAPWTEALRDALAEHAGPADTLILRDYHAENVVWLPERRGRARLGLLDYQDAMRGPAAYDLASLTRDARRDVSPDAARAATARFAEGSGAGEAGLSAAVAVLAVQRNVRLLGIFTRLAARGKPAYLRFLPRVWAQLTADLDHPACAGVRAPLLAALPTPGPAVAP